MHFILQLVVYYPGTSGTSAESTEQCYLLAYSLGFAQPASQGPLAQRCIAHSELGPPKSIISQENIPQANLVGIFSVKVPSSDDSRLWLVDIKSVSTPIFLLS